MTRHLTLFLCLLALLVAVAGGVGARFIIVDDDWPLADHDQIQDAIDNATDGDIIYVYAGTYAEDVVVNRSVTLWGNGSGETVVDGTVLALGIEANATIKYMTLRDANNGIAATAPEVRLRGLELSGISDIAISVEDGGTCRMSNITIDGGVRGFNIDNRTDVTILNSTVSGVSLFSVHTREVARLTLADVTITGSSTGIDLGMHTGNATLDRIDVSGAGDGIALKDVVNVTVGDSRLVSCTTGLSVTIATGLALRNVTIEGAAEAIVISEGRSIVLDDLRVNGSSQRHLLTDDTSLEMTDSVLTNCSKAFPALYLRDSTAVIERVLVDDADAAIGLETGLLNLINCTLRTDSDLELIQSSRATTLNTTFGNVTTDSHSRLIARNFLHVRVTNAMGAVPGVEILVTDDGQPVYATPTFGGSDDRTGIDGTAGWIVVAFAEWNGTDLHLNSTNVTVMLGPWDETRTVNMTASRLEEFTRPYALDIHVDDDATMPMNGSVERPYDTVGRAVDNATDGDIIHVADGDYPACNVDRPVRITGGAAALIEDLVLVADGVILDGLAVGHLEVAAACDILNITDTGSGIDIASGGNATMTNVTVDGPVTVIGGLNWTGGSVANGTGLNVTTSGVAILTNVIQWGGGVLAEGRIEWTGGAIVGAPDGVTLLSSGRLVDLRLENCSAGLLVFGDDVVIRNVTVVDSAAGVSAVNVTGVVLEDVMVDGPVRFDGSTDLTLDGVDVTGNLSISGSIGFLLRNCSMGDLILDGTVRDHFIHDIDGSNLCGGRPVLYAVDPTEEDIDAAGYGYIGIVGGNGSTLRGLSRDARAMLVFSTEMSVKNANITTPGRIEVLDSTASVADVTLGNGTLMARGSRLEAANVTGGPLRLVGSTADIDGVAATGLDLLDSVATSVNLTYRDMSLGNSTLMIINWLSIRVVVPVRGEDDIPVEGADVLVVAGATTAYATGGFGGMDPTTDPTGRTPWFTVPFAVIDASGEETVTLNVTVRRGVAEGRAAFVQNSSSRRTVPVPDRPPTVILDLPANSSGIVHLNVTVIDEDADPVSLEVRFSTDNVTWSPATLMESVDGLAANNSGVAHHIRWDSVVDLPTHDGTARLRVTPSDGYLTGNGTEAMVTLANADIPHPPSLVLLTPPDGATVNTTAATLAWNATDIDGDALTFTVRIAPLNETPWSAQMAGHAWTVSNLTDGTTYAWNVTVTDGTFNVASDPRTFTVDTGAPDRAPPSIVHVPVTTAYRRVPLTISAYVFDDRRVHNVTLVYLTGPRSVPLAMTGGPIYGATIPAGDVVEGLRYYIEATDGRNMATSPDVGEPYDVDVQVPWDHTPPVIDHTPATDWTYGDPLTITARVSDDRYVERVEVLYGDPSDPTGFVGVEMLPEHGDRRNDTYTAVIPDAAVVPDRVTYWIRATDGVNNITYGNRSDPVVVPVVVRERVMEANVTFFGGGADVRIAVFGPGDLSVSLAVDPSGGRGDDIGIFIDVRIEGGEANVSWVNVTIHYGELDPTVMPSRLRLFYWDESSERWIMAHWTGVNVEEGYVWGNMTHLTVLAPLVLDDGGGERVSLLPLMLAVTAVVIAIVLVIVLMKHRRLVERLRRRARMVTCPRCRAEIEDNAAHRCPECGALLPTSTEEKAWRDEMAGEKGSIGDRSGPEEGGPDAGTGPDEDDEALGTAERPPVGPGGPSLDFTDLGGDGAEHIQRYGSMRAPEPRVRPDEEGVMPTRTHTPSGDVGEDLETDTPEWEGPPGEGPDGWTPVDEGTPIPEWEGEGSGGEGAIREVPPDDEGAPEDTPEWEGPEGGAGVGEGTEGRGGKRGVHDEGNDGWGARPLDGDTGG